MRQAILAPPRHERAMAGKGFPFFLLLIPGLFLFLLFTIYPVGKLLVMSFFDWRIGGGQVTRFVSLENYRAVFTDSVSGTAVANTALYTLVTVPMQVVLGLAVAVFIQTSSRFRLFFRILYYLPVITSWVIVSLMFRYLFFNEGFVNYLLTDLLRLSPAGIHWLDSRYTALTVAVLLGTWKGVGWTMVIFLAALQAIPLDLYEVAALDGCGRWKAFLKVTLPSLQNTLLFAVVMLTIGGFNVFTSIKLLTDGRPAHQTEVVLTWMYFKAFEAGQLGYAAALSYIVASIIGIVAALQFGYFRRFRD